jgi:predicted ATPase/DNA-binding CsgD family transcriptional regulator/Tfp pilus assembly protein PilF
VQTQEFAAPATRLIGRERELVVLRARLLDEGARLMTVTGPPGVGKTRLATEVAKAVAESFPDGVFFIDLAPLTDADLVESVIAAVIGVRDIPERSLIDSLATALAEKRVLLVLDNFEQVAAAAPVVADLLRSCPATVVLVTSRETLRVSAERIFPVSPLAVPAHDLSLSELREVDAVRLFVDRARAASPGFSLAAENAAEVADVCRRLDGLPLAIELTAARANVLSPRMMLERWDQGLALSMTGARDLPPRQRTLRTAFDWSYELLPADEQSLLRRLAVFVGGFTLSAVEAACRGVPDTLPQLEVDPLDALSSLVDRSLVRTGADASSDRRFSLLVPIREYLRGRLAEAGEEDAARLLQADFCVRLAEEVEPEVDRGPQAAGFDRLESEHGNLRTALRWLVLRGEPAAAVRLATSLFYFWEARYVEEGRQWLEAALARADASVSAGLRARGTRAAAVLANNQGDYARGRALAEESVACARRVRDELALARGLHTLGNAASSEGDDRAVDFYRESLKLFEKTGHRPGQAAILNGLGELARAGGRLEEATSLYRESLLLARESGDERILSVALHNLGHIALQQGDAEQADALFAEAMEVSRQLGDRPNRAACLVAQAQLIATTGPTSRAATLLGAADAQMEAAGVRLEPIDRESFERCVQAARADLGDARFEELWWNWRRLTLDEAVVAVERARQSGQTAAATAANGLTERELEVIRLVAEGLSNTEIGARLFVSEHTVHRHLANIRRKLKLSSRAAVAVHAARHGLL